MYILYICIHKDDVDRYKHEDHPTHIFRYDFSERFQVAEVSDAQGSMLVIGRPVEDGSILG